MGFLPTAIDDRSSSGRTLHFTGDFFADLERADSNVRSDRGEELGGIVSQPLDGVRHHAGHRSPPPRVHRGDVPTCGVSEEDRHAVGRARCNGDSIESRDEPVALCVRNRQCVVCVCELPSETAMYLTLLEQTFEGDAQTLGKTCAVLANELLVVAQVKAEVQPIIGRCAHAAVPRGEGVAKTASGEKGRAKHAHGVFCSMPCLRETGRRAKSRAPKPGQGVGWCIDFLPSSGQRRYESR